MDEPINNTVRHFLDEANPRELLEAYFDAKTHEKDSIKKLPNVIVEECIRHISVALEKLPVYGRDNKIVTREKYFEAIKKLKESGF